MPTAILRPDADVGAFPWSVSGTHWGGGTNGETWDAINEEVGQPTAGDGWYVGWNKNDDGKEYIFSFTTTPGITQATAITVWLYASVQNVAVQPTLKLKVGEDWLSTPCAIETTDQGSWTSYTFADLSASQEDIDGLQASLTAPTPLETGQNLYLDTVYVVVTHDDEPSGFSGPFPTHRALAAPQN